MAAPLLIIIGTLLRQFLSWAVKQLIKRYGKKILLRTFRDGMLLIVRESKIFKNCKIRRGNEEIPLEQWMREAPIEELQSVFQKDGIELTPTQFYIPGNTPMNSIPKGKLNSDSQSILHEGQQLQQRFRIQQRPSAYMHQSNPLKPLF